MKKLIVLTLIAARIPSALFAEAQQEQVKGVEQLSGAVRIAGAGS